MSGFTVMLLFLNKFTADLDSFFNVSSYVSILDATEIYCHLQNYEYQYSLLTAASR